MEERIQESKEDLVFALEALCLELEKKEEWSLLKDAENIRIKLVYLIHSED